MRKVFLVSAATVAITGLLSIISSVWAECNAIGSQSCCEKLSCNNGVMKKEELREAWFEPNFNASTGFGY